LDFPLGETQRKTSMSPSHLQGASCCMPFYPRLFIIWPPPPQVPPLVMLRCPSSFVIIGLYMATLLALSPPPSFPLFPLPPPCSPLRVPGPPPVSPGPRGPHRYPAADETAAGPDVAGVPVIVGRRFPPKWVSGTFALPPRPGRVLPLDQLWPPAHRLRPNQKPGFALYSRPRPRCGLRLIPGTDLALFLRWPTLRNPAGPVTV